MLSTISISSSGRTSTALGVVLVGLALSSVAQAGKPDLGTQIEQRLERAGNLTFPMAPMSDYLQPGDIRPETGFYVYAGLHSPQSFRFSVEVYRTAAQAAAAYRKAVAQVYAIGGDFHAFNVVRSGRVLYMGSTAGAPDPDNPALPVK